MESCGEVFIPAEFVQSDAVVLRARVAVFLLGEPFSHRTPGFPRGVVYGQMCDAFKPMPCMQMGSVVDGVQTWVRTFDPRKNVNLLLKKVKKGEEVSNREMRPEMCFDCKLSQGNRLKCPVWRLGVVREVAKAKAKREKISIKVAEEVLLG